MNDEPSARDPIAEDARIESLEKRLQAAKEREEERNRPASGTGTDANYRMGSKVLSELVGGIGGGALIGWVIDRLVIERVSGGTSHWGLLVMMFLGIIVAFRNIIRISNRRPD
ncbi:MAG: AtpZ/AtpI family protein [Novosphingobium sp.]